MSARRSRSKESRRRNVREMYLMSYLGGDELDAVDLAVLLLLDQLSNSGVAIGKGRVLESFLYPEERVEWDLEPSPPLPYAPFMTQRKKRRQESPSFRPNSQRCVLRMTSVYSSD
jgi:glutathione S-transferase